MMDRFNYPSLKAAYRESTELLYLLECESYGDKRDEKEELERQQMETEAQVGNHG